MYHACFINKYLVCFKVATNGALVFAQCAAYETAWQLRRNARRATTRSHNLTNNVAIFLFLCICKKHIKWKHTERRRGTRANPGSKQSSARLGCRNTPDHVSRDTMSLILYKRGVQLWAATQYSNALRIRLRLVWLGQH